MARYVRLFFLLATFAAGVIGGFTGRRHEERVRLPPARQRTASLKSALWAYETGEKTRVRPALLAFRALGEAPREDVAEADLLEALLDAESGGGDLALRRVQEAWPMTQAAARAAWERVQRAATPAERQAARKAFAAAHPHAWVLQPPAGRAGP